MKTLVRQYNQFRKMEREIYSLRNENKYLRDWLQKYENEHQESQKDAGEGFRATLELVRMINGNKHASAD